MSLITLSIALSIALSLVWSDDTETDITKSLNAASSKLTEIKTSIANSGVSLKESFRLANNALTSKNKKTYKFPDDTTDSEIQLAKSSDIPTDDEIKALINNGILEKVNTDRINSLIDKYVDEMLVDELTNNKEFNETVIKAVRINVVNGDTDGTTTDKVYTTTQAENLFATKEDTYTKSDVDGKFNNYYTKSEVDSKLIFSDYYTKEEVNNELGLYYTKETINSKLAEITTTMSSFYKQEDVEREITEALELALSDADGAVITTKIDTMMKDVKTQSDENAKHIKTIVTIIESIVQLLENFK